MTQIKKDELYRHLSAFLKKKGVELHTGPYSQRIRQGCTLLADTINFSQKTIEKAKVGMDANLGRMRTLLKKKPPKMAGNAKTKATKTKAAKAKRAARSKASTKVSAKVKKTKRTKRKTTTRK